MAPGTRGTTAQPGQPSNRGKFRPNNEDDQDQDQFVEAGNLQPTEAQPTQADMQALQRELDKTKQELAALQALSVSIKKDPMPGPSSASKTNRLAGKAKQAINNEGRNLRQSEQTTFSMREQTIALPSAAEQEAAAIQYLSFVENMAKYGRSRAQFKFPSLTGMTNYRAWAQNVKLLLNQHRLVQIIEGQAGSLPPYHPKYDHLRVLKGDAQLMIVNAVNARINGNLRFSKDPEPERLWKSLRDQYDPDIIY